MVTPQFEHKAGSTSRRIGWSSCHQCGRKANDLGVVRLARVHSHCRLNSNTEIRPQRCVANFQLILLTFKFKVCDPAARRDSFRRLRDRGRTGQELSRRIRAIGGPWSCVPLWQPPSTAPIRRHCLFVSVPSYYDQSLETAAADLLRQSLLRISLQLCWKLHHDLYNMNDVT